MKIKGFKIFEEKEKKPNEHWYDSRYDNRDDDDFDNYPSEEGDDGLFGRPVHHSQKIHGGYDPDAEDVSSDDMEHLYYLIRTVFKNEGIHVSIEKRGLDLSICILVNKKEKIKNLLNIFNTVSKVRNDILPQYDCEFQMLNDSNTGHPELIFGFFYDHGDGDDREPF
jgi:hypothetical protein